MTRCKECRAVDAARARERRKGEQALFHAELQRWEDDLAAASYGYATEAKDLVERGDIRPRPRRKDYDGHS